LHAFVASDANPDISPRVGLSRNRDSRSRPAATWRDPSTPVWRICCRGLSKLRGAGPPGCSPRG